MFRLDKGSLCVKILINLVICIFHDALLANKAIVYHNHAVMFGPIRVVNVIFICVRAFTVSTDNKNQNIDV